MNVRIIAIAGAMAIATTPSVSFAQSSSTSVPKDGSCPSGFKSSGSNCVSTGGKPAITKVGSCPSTFKSSGNYCVGTSSSSYAEVRSGSCSSGLKTAGKDCIK